MRCFWVLHIKTSSSNLSISLTVTRLKLRANTLGESNWQGARHFELAYISEQVLMLSVKYKKPDVILHLKEDINGHNGTVQ